MAATVQRRQLWIDVLPSTLGDIRIVCSDETVCAIGFVDVERPLPPVYRHRDVLYELVERRDPLGVRVRLERYFAGDLSAIDALCVDGGGTAYQERVWAALRTIPAGQTRSYGQIAAQVGATHARAVGGANALNPNAIAVPCHRVIGADATLTGYAGGLRRKRWLLDHEARYTGGPLTLF